jgi:hypothetical protein
LVTLPVADAEGPAIFVLLGACCALLLVELASVNNNIPVIV